MANFTVFNRPGNIDMADLWPEANGANIEDVLVADASQYWIKLTNGTYVLYTGTGMAYGGRTLQVPIAGTYESVEITDAAGEVLARLDSFDPALAAEIIEEPGREILFFDDVLSDETRNSTALLGGDGNDLIVSSGRGYDQLSGGNGNDWIVVGTSGGPFEWPVVADGGVGYDTLEIRDADFYGSLNLKASAVTSIEVLSFGIASRGFIGVQFTANQVGPGLSPGLAVRGVDGQSDSISFEMTSASTSLNLSGFAFFDWQDADYDGINIAGTASADTITGSVMADYIQGGLGNDTINGGAGRDIIAWDDATAAIVFTLSASGAGLGPNIAGIGRDTYSSIEGVVGGNADDQLAGNAGDNVLQGWNGSDTLNGAGGNDILFADAGNDTLMGGLGNDTYYLSELNDTISEALNEGYDTVNATLYAYALGANVERVNSTNEFVNFVGIGNTLDNRFQSLGGNDRFVDIAGGADIFSGGLGSDTIDFRSSATGVILNFVTGNHGGAATGDLYASIEKFLGSDAANDTMTARNNGRFVFAGYAGNDTLNGANRDDQLLGQAGNDRLSGLAGRDTLDGGIGNDQMTGGADRDVFVYVDAAFGDDIINGFEDGLDKFKVFSAVADDITDFAIHDNGTTAVLLTLIANPAHSIRINGAAVATIDAADFVFY